MTQLQLYAACFVVRSIVHIMNIVSNKQFCLYAVYYETRNILCVCVCGGGGGVIQLTVSKHLLC